MFVRLFLIAFTMLLFTAPKAQENKEEYRVVAINAANPDIKSISNTTELVLPTRVYFPNAFTPDRDGQNDRFGAIGINAMNYDLKIYSRQGELLYASSDINDRWDGTYKGQLVPEGVYVYTFRANEVETGKVITKSGTVTVIL